MGSKIIEEDIVNISEDIKNISRKFSNSTILITGGAGFLGKYFIGVLDYLNKNVLDKPCKIISVDNFITGIDYDVKESQHFKAIKHNIKEPLEIDENIDYIIHAAGIASPKFYREYKLETIEVGTFGTRNILELAKEKKVKSMIYFSSSEVYGDPDPKFVPTPETYNGNVSFTGPRANYDESKRLGETLCSVYFEIYKVPIKSIRPFNVYGPGIRLDDNRVVPNFIAHILQNKPLPLYGTGNHTRTFCYISDAITGFLKVLLSDLDGEAFNVGNEKPEVSMEDLAKTFIELFNFEPGIVRKKSETDAYNISDPQRRCPDLKKMRTKLDYNPKVDLKAGLKRFMDWAKETQKK